MHKKVRGFLTIVLLLISNIESLNLMGSKNLTILAEAEFSIQKSEGYTEGAYVQWVGPISDEYSVYYSNGDSYTKIDKMLIRQYPDYFRADAVGLKAGTYTLKVVGKSSGEKITSSLTVTAFDRSGFHNSPNSPTYEKGVGAYNLDGTLKSGAKVLYVT